MSAEVGIHAVVAKGEVSLRLNFEHAATDLGALTLNNSQSAVMRSPIAIDPKEIDFLRSNHSKVGADFEVYSGPLTINFEQFRKMVPGTGVPDLTIIDQVRTPDTATGIDSHFGLMNKGNVRALLMLSEYMKPSNVLMIGTGRGLVDALLAQTMPEGARLDTVDPGHERVRNSDTIVPVNAVNQRYIRYGVESDVGAYISRAEDAGLIPQGRVVQHRLDSTEFFRQRAAEFRQREADGRDSLRYDLIVIDGNHTFPQPEIDINYALGFLRPGGVLLIDDWQKLATNAGVTSAGLELTHEHRRFLYHLGNAADPKDLQTDCVFMIHVPSAIRVPLRAEVVAARHAAEEFRDEFFKS